MVQNPGVPKESKYLKIAKKTGVPIENEASLFFKYCPAKIVGITGTRGKSTVSALVYELLKKGKRKIWLAGLPQKPMLEILDKVKTHDIVILELSSWQLEILGQQKLSPHISIIINIYPDHLNRYSGLSAYIAAKKNIFTHQNRDNFAILNLDNGETKKMGGTVVCQRFWFSQKYFSSQNGSFVKNNKIIFRRDSKETTLASLKDIKLAGEHNLENILAAVTLAGIFKISGQKIKSVLKQFSGLPDRMELVKMKGRIKYINDTTATMPDATIAALQALNSKKIILIAGGASKKIPQIKYKKLAKEIKKNCKAVILFSGQGSNQISKELKSLKFKPVVTEVSNMTEAVSLAKSFSKKNDIVLLSPACASFGLFIHEFDRGEQFKKVVSKL
jgi:UDP-N-acetylmuramoylalanine--D-glutamate ligase